MYLTRIEEKVYDGEHGWAHQLAMRILVRLGELFGASRLIRINSSHIAGVSYKTVGDAAIDFLEAISNAGGKVQVYSTLNPSSFDKDLLGEMRITEERKERQLRIINTYKRMGVDPALTCTPYYVRRPKPNQHLAWSESSAVVYANSVLGSWTNREGGPSALAAALIGKAPDHGVHQADNRRAGLKVKVEARLRDPMEFGALGFYVGKIARDKIPAFEFLQKCGEADLKQLSAGLATGGMTPMFYHDFKGVEKGVEAISVDAKAIKDAVEGLSIALKGPKFIFIGCPHCSPKELAVMAKALMGKRIKEGVRLWICCSRRVKEKAKGHVEVIERAGAHVLCDTCAVVTWLDALGVDEMMTNSAKAAYYMPSLNKVRVTLSTLNRCLAAAIN